MEPVSMLLPVGVSLVKLLLRASDNAAGAGMLGDAVEGYSALRRLRGKPTEQRAAEAIANKLSGRLELQRLEAGEIDGTVAAVVAIFDGLAEDSAAVLAAVRDADDFPRFVRERGADRARANTSIAAEGIFEAVLAAASQEFIELAPFSRRFVPAALTDLMSHLAVVSHEVSRANDSLGRIERRLGTAEFSSVAVRVGAVPGKLPDAVVRHEELTALRAALDHRLVAVCLGGRGAGKSQLAAAYVHEQVAAGCEVVVWLNAESADSLVDGLADLAQHLGFNRSDHNGNSLPSAKSALRWLNNQPRRGVVVFDNALTSTGGHGDTVAPVRGTSVGELTDWLPTTSSCDVILTTTDHALKAVGREVVVGPFSKEQAQSYLAHRCNHLDPEGADAIAAAFDCLPLALAQSVPVINGQCLTAQDYLEKLAAAPLSRSIRITPGYPRTLARAVTLSVEELGRDPDLIRVLEFLAILGSGGVGRHILQQSLIPTSPELDLDHTLERITGNSLASWSRNGEAVTMHRVVSRVLRDNMTEAGVLPKALTRGMFALRQSFPVGEQQYTEGPEISRHVFSVLDHALSVELDEESSHALLKDAWALAKYGSDSSNARMNIALFGRLQLIANVLHLDPLSPIYINLMSDSSSALRLLGRYDEALQIDQQVLAIYRSQATTPPTTLAEAEYSLALDYGILDEWLLSFRGHARALAIRSNNASSDTRWKLRSRNKTAEALLRLGHPTWALTMELRTLADRAKELPAGDPDIAASHGLLAQIELSSLNFLASIVHAREAVRIFEETHGASHPDTLNAKITLCASHFAAQQLTAGFALADEVLPKLRSTQGLDHPETVRLEYLVCAALASINDWQACLESGLPDILDRCLKVLPITHPLVRQCGHLLLNAYMHVGDAAKKEELQSRLTYLRVQYMAFQALEQFLTNEGVAGI